MCVPGETDLRRNELPGKTDPGRNGLPGETDLGRNGPGEMDRAKRTAGETDLFLGHDAPATSEARKELQSAVQK